MTQALTLATLVTGSRSTTREAAIAERIDPHLRTAVILEGLPDGNGQLQPSSNHSQLTIARIAAGCMCCAGNLVMRVTLNRILRDKPARLYIGIASDEHIGQLKNFLSMPPYDAWLSLTDDIVGDSADN